jgi:hypothetical protein
VDCCVSIIRMRRWRGEQPCCVGGKGQVYSLYLLHSRANSLEGEDKKSVPVWLPRGHSPDSVFEVEKSEGREMTGLPPRSVSS